MPAHGNRELAGVDGTCWRGGNAHTCYRIRFMLLLGQVTISLSTKGAMRAMLKDVGIGLVFLAVVAVFSSSSADWRSEAQVIGEVFQYIEQEYLYPVDLTKCRFDMLKELSRRNPESAKSGEGPKDDPANFVCLDRYSGLSTPDETRMTSEDMSGHFGGGGVQIKPRDGQGGVV